jgi:hypothetical protein
VLKKPTVPEIHPIATALGPPRFFTAAQHDGRYRVYRVVDLELHQCRSVMEALQTKIAHCSGLLLTHMRPEQGQH